MTRRRPAIPNAETQANKDADVDEGDDGHGGNEADDEGGPGPSITYEERMATTMIATTGISSEQAMNLATLVGQVAEMTRTATTEEALAALRREMEQRKLQKRLRKKQKKDSGSIPLEELMPQAREKMLIADAKKAERERKEEEKKEATREKLPALQLSNVGLPLPASYTHFSANMRAVVNSVYLRRQKNGRKCLQHGNTKS